MKARALKAWDEGCHLGGSISLNRAGMGLLEHFRARCYGLEVYRGAGAGELAVKMPMRVVTPATTMSTKVLSVSGNGSTLKTAVKASIAWITSCAPVPGCQVFSEVIRVLNALIAACPSVLDASPSRVRIWITVGSISLCECKSCRFSVFAHFDSLDCVGRIALRNAV